MNNDIQVLKFGYGVEDFLVDDRTTSSITTTIKPGEPTMKGGSGGNFAIPITNGKPIGGTDLWFGVAHKESTETSTADGICAIELVGPRTQLKGRATAPSNMNTAAKLLAIRNDYVNFDVTASSGTNGIFTIDEDEGDDQDNRSLFIMGGDIAKGTLNVFACGPNLFVNAAATA